MASRIVSDISAALVVSFLTIAAGSAFGLLTGLGAQAGILSMVVASLIGWVFGGAPIKVSGPTGPTASAMISTTAALLAFDAGNAPIFAALALAGVGLFTLSFLPTQKVMSFVPNVATAAFINGVSLVIILGQLRKLRASYELSGATAAWEISIALGTVAFLTLWPTISRPVAATQLGRLLSGSLVAMAIGVVLVVLFAPPIKTLEIEALSFDSLWVDFLPGFTAVPLPALAFAALKLCLTLAFVTLVSSRALSINANYGAELRNQGSANLAMAAIGGVPATIGFIRTRILQRSGAQTTFAGIATALLVLGFVLVAPGLLQLIPSAVFTGILLRAAWTGFDWQFLTAFRGGQHGAILAALLVVGGAAIMLFADGVVVVAGVTILWWLI